MPEMPYVNQEANSDEMRARRSLKSGMLKIFSMLPLRVGMGNIPFRNDPRNDPEGEGDRCPRSQSQPCSLTHVLCAAKDADVDVLGRDMAIYDTCNNDLRRSQKFQPNPVGGRTVGMAMP